MLIDLTRVPMPPTRYDLDSTRLGEVPPDRCPGGHRLLPGKMLLSSGLGQRHYTCCQCEPPLTFAPEAELYDDLSWWFEPAQVQRREYWAEYRRRHRRP